MEHQGNATLVQHSLVFGRSETAVRCIKTGEPRPYAQYPVSVLIAFQEPRKRKWCFTEVLPDNLRYITIEVGGRVVWDSRSVVPYDESAHSPETTERLQRLRGHSDSFKIVRL